MKGISRMKPLAMLAVSTAAVTSLGAEPTYANTYHPLKSPSGVWSEVASWYNDTTSAKATEIPGANDCVKLNQNGRNVTADGCAVEYGRMNVGEGTSVTSSYSQVGGSLKSGYWTFVGYNGGTGSMYLENVDAVLSGFRLSVGNQADKSANPANSVFRMKGGTLTTDYTDGLLTSTWGRNKGTSTLDFDGTTWTNKSAGVKIGFGSVNTNRVLFKNGTFQNEKAFHLGANVQNWGATTECGYDEAIFENSVWTNKGEIILGPALQHKTRLVLSNTVFAAMNSGADKHALSMGFIKESDDTLEIRSCPQFYTAKGPEAGSGTNSTSRILVKGQKGSLPSAFSILNSFTFHGNPGRTFEIEVADSEYTPTANFNALRSSGQDWRWVFRDCDLDWGSRYLHVNNDKSGRAEVVFCNSSFTNLSVTVAKSGNATNATLRLVNSTLRTYSMLVADADVNTQRGKLVVDGTDGRLVATQLQMPRNGYGELIITNGAKVEADQVYGPNRTGSNARYFLDGDFTVMTKMAASNQGGTTGELVQVSGTFDCSSASSISLGNNTDSRFVYTMKGGKFRGSSSVAVYLGNGARSSGVLDLQGGEFATKCFHQSLDTGASTTIRCDGGTLKALADLDAYGSPKFIVSSITTSVSDGGAVFDLGGHAGIEVASCLAHDSAASAKDGGLRVKGAGTMRVTTAPTFTGDLIVDEGTLTFTKNITLGASAALGGGGTLVLNGGQTVTVGGDWKVDAAHPNGLTVQGGVTFGAEATVSVPAGVTLDEGVRYKLVTATTVTGVPTAGANIPEGWTLAKKGNSICLKKTQGFAIIFR